MRKLQKEEAQRRACLDKVKYRTKALALKQAELRGLAVYKCPYCRKYHLTSTADRNRTKDLITIVVDNLIKALFGKILEVRRNNY